MNALILPLPIEWNLPWEISSVNGIPVRMQARCGRTVVCVRANDYGFLKFEFYTADGSYIRTVDYRTIAKSELLIEQLPEVQKMGKRIANEKIQRIAMEAYELLWSI